MKRGETKMLTAVKKLDKYFLSRSTTDSYEPWHWNASSRQLRLNVVFAWVRVRSAASSSWLLVAWAWMLCGMYEPLWRLEICFVLPCMHCAVLSASISITWVVGHFLAIEHSDFLSTNSIVKMILQVFAESLVLTEFSHSHIRPSQQFQQVSAWSRW